VPGKELPLCYGYARCGCPIDERGCHHDENCGNLRPRVRMDSVEPDELGGEECPADAEVTAQTFGNDQAMAPVPSREVRGLVAPATTSPSWTTGSTGSAASRSSRTRFAPRTAGGSTSVQCPPARSLQRQSPPDRPRRVHSLLGAAGCPGGAALRFSKGPSCPSFRA
jgi:hypothetical protein